jgi:hypothetical protein
METATEIPVRMPKRVEMVEMVEMEMVEIVVSRDEGNSNSFTTWLDFNVGDWHKSFPVISSVYLQNIQVPSLSNN